MHLTFDYIGACLEKKSGHAQDIMRELGISWTHSTPQSITDSFWFWNCSNIPETLPSYITELKADPKKKVGWGLSQAMADEITSMAK